MTYEYDEPERIDIEEAAAEQHKDQLRAGRECVRYERADPRNREEWVCMWSTRLGIEPEEARKAWEEKYGYRGEQQ